MAFDDILPYIGEFGAYQKCSFILLSMVCLYAGYQAMAPSFLGPDHDHWCLVEELNSLPFSQQKYVAIPEDESGYERCIYYVMDYNQSVEELCTWDLDSNQTRPPSASCSKWVYDVTQFASTSVSAYDLVCERAFLVGLVYSSWLLSLLLAAFFTGIFSDNFGRKPMYNLTIVLAILIGIGCAYANTYGAFLTMRFVLGLCINAANSCAFVLIIESTGNRYREVTGTIYWLFYGFGFILLPIIAYFVTDFRTLQIVLACIMIPSTLNIVLIPESPRWLATVGKTEQSLTTLQFVAEVNNKQLPENAEQIIMSDIGVVLKEESDENSKWHILFENTTMLKTSVILLPAWIASALVYNSLSFNTGALSGNLYMNTFWSGVAEIPGNLLPMILIRFIGRRNTIIASLILAGGFCLISVPFTTPEGSSVVTALSLIGKVFIVCAYTTIYLFTAELFPTSVRHIAHGIINAIANIVSMISPYMGAPLMAIWLPLPLLVFGLLGVATGPLLLFLPETDGDDLPDTLEEAEALWQNRKRPSKIGRNEEQPEKPTIDTCHTENKDTMSYTEFTQL